MLGIALVSVAAEQQTTVVSGRVQTGTIINASSHSEEKDLTFVTNDARLGTNSGNRYWSKADYRTLDAEWVYNAALNIQMQMRHQLGLVLEGKHDWNRTTGTRTETVYDKHGAEISIASGAHNHPQDRMNDILTGVNYTYSLPRQGDSLKVGYRYHWDYTLTGLVYKTSNTLDQQVTEQTHRAWVDYVCRLNKGHALDMGVAYDRRQMDAHTMQVWEQQPRLDADYSHLTQYGAVYARYRLRIGNIKAAAGLEYRATRMQQRWLHDLVPTAMLHWQVDSVHGLTAEYRMMIIRPEYCQLDTNHIRDTYTQSFGNDALVGTHVHNTHLTYRMALEKVTFSAVVRYITANDGLNALWMERNNIRIYTWGNEGIRHAVSLSPQIDSRLGKTTRLKVSATVLWDERVAKAIQMSNANWGIRAQVNLEQQLPLHMAMALYGDYAYHNTLDLYSYEGHGGRVGAHWTMAWLRQHNLRLKIGYTCRFRPDIHITQGGWTGLLSSRPTCMHLAEVQVGYSF